MEAVNKFKVWRKTRLGQLVLAVIELAASYGVTSLAINNGNLIYYLVALCLLSWGIKNLIKLIGSLMNYGKLKHKTS